MIFSTECAASLKLPGIADARTTQQSLEDFAREALNYVWLIEPLESPCVVPADLRMIRKSGQSFLYRVSYSAR